MKTIYLKFTDKEEMYNILADFRATEKDEEGNKRSYWKSGENIAFDEVGTIYRDTGNKQTITDEDDNEIEIPVMEKVDGYHLNILCRTDKEYNEIMTVLGEDKDNYVVTPDNPSRVFA